jgi:hypothetical protein
VGRTEIVRALITKCGVGVTQNAPLQRPVRLPLHVAVLHGQAHLIPGQPWGRPVDAVIKRSLHAQSRLHNPVVTRRRPCPYPPRADARHHTSRRPQRQPYTPQRRGYAASSSLLADAAPSMSTPLHHRGPQRRPTHIAAMFDNALQRNAAHTLSGGTPQPQMHWGAP